MCVCVCAATDRRPSLRPHHKRRVRDLHPVAGEDDFHFVVGGRSRSDVSHCALAVNVLDHLLRRPLQRADRAQELKGGEVGGWLVSV